MMVVRVALLVACWFCCLLYAVRCLSLFACWLLVVGCWWQLFVFVCNCKKCMALVVDCVLLDVFVVCC